MKNGLATTVQIKPSLFSSNPTEGEESGTIHSFDPIKKTVLVRIAGGLKGKNNFYDLHFGLNRSTYLAQHRALFLMKENELFEKIVDNNLFHQPSPYQHSEFTPIKELNDDQNEAVKNILETKLDAPLLLFGPPGKFLDCYSIVLQSLFTLVAFFSLSMIRFMISILFRNGQNANTGGHNRRNCSKHQRLCASMCTN